jgi:superfamily I DNA and/or RNA helicase
MKFTYKKAIYLASLILYIEIYSSIDRAGYFYSIKYKNNQRLIKFLSKISVGMTVSDFPVQGQSSDPLRPLPFYTTPVHPVALHRKCVLYL